MHTDGGGWTVFQRRQDGSENFYRGWTDYQNGFGNLNGEFWLGLDKIYRLTNRDDGADVSLRVDLRDENNNTVYAKYSSFRILGSSDNYSLYVSGFSGNAGDSLAYHSGSQFSTYDRDNDQSNGENCADTSRGYGAWWYHSCYYSNLNGHYFPVGATLFSSVRWNTFNSRSLAFTEMKVRRTG